MDRDTVIKVRDSIQQRVELIEGKWLMRIEATLSDIQQQCSEIRHWVEVLDTMLGLNEKPRK